MKKIDGVLAIKEQIAQARGKRLRICRGYTGLNIKEFCHKHQFNVITFGRWEKGNKVSLNDRNVDKVCHALLNEGIICSPSWLLEGTGAAPRESTGQSLFQENNNNTASDNIASATFSALLAFSEMEIFQNNNPDAVTVVIDNLAMAPLYDLGDYVGGIKLAREEYSLANHKNCLIKLSGSPKLMLRNVQLSGNKLIFTATNSKSPHSEATVLEGFSELEIIAPVIFHRKTVEWVRKKV